LFYAYKKFIDWLKYLIKLSKLSISVFILTFSYIK
jgi:hypothetical protein